MVEDITSIDSIDIKGKRVFIRVDFNCPLTEDGYVEDDSRIVATLPTIKYAKEQRARIILASHLGRPKGKGDKKFSLLPVAERLAELLKEEVFFPEDCIGDSPDGVLQRLHEGQIMLLENLRFHEEEEKNDEDFSQKLASLADVYINDAFGVSHRAHASVHAITKYIKIKGAGFLMLKEIKNLSRLLSQPEQPFILILGGAKVSDKVGVLTNLLPKVKTILIGGAMASTFLHAKGKKLGKSKVEIDKIDTAIDILERASLRNTEIVLPVDLVGAKDLKEDSEYSVYDIDNFPDGYVSVDIGPKTIEAFSSYISTAKTIFWNGPMGVFEITPFSKGTEHISRSVAKFSKMSVAGGGDTVSAINKFALAPFFSHISTGGGASLEFLEGKELPGIVALKEKK